MNANHAGLLEPANVRSTSAAVTRVADDDLAAIADVTMIMAGLDRQVQRRVAAFVYRRYGSDD